MASWTRHERFQETRGRSPPGQTNTRRRSLGTRKAQASKTENGEVILRGNVGLLCGHGTLESCMTSAFCLGLTLFSRSPNQATHPHPSVSATSVCLIWGAQKLWPTVDRGTTRLGYRVQKCSAGRAATRGVIVSTRSQCQWLLLIYEPHGRGVRISAFPFRHLVY